MTTKSPTPKIPEGRIAQVRKYGAFGARFCDRTSVSARAGHVIISGEFELDKEQEGHQPLYVCRIQVAGHQ